MFSLELNQKQLTYIILALEAYVKTLEQDEDDPGPSMTDSMYVSNLAKVLREKHEEGATARPGNQALTSQAGREDPA
ncbi:MAG: hypothetical protein J5I93_01680 [Pirellulaceae bacterium]|nr:hypothetical protein [Pirellulaceae bacterium]